MFLLNSLYLDLVYFVLILCSFIPAWVFFILGWQTLVDSGTSHLPNEGDLVELVWTVVPSTAVTYLCLLNLQCLGLGMQAGVDNVVKIIGSQWYWSYDNVLTGDGVYDSVMLDFTDSVDKPLRLSMFITYTLLITASDVIHSFAIPNFNLKVDAIPGRINQAYLCPDRLGVFVGYCSELCGAGHAYMPIVLEIVKGKRK